MVATCLPALGPLVFEAESVFSSLRSTLSGFLPLIGNDSGSEKIPIHRPSTGNSDANKALETHEMA